MLTRTNIINLKKTWLRGSGGNFGGLGGGGESGGKEVPVVPVVLFETVFVGVPGLVHSRKASWITVDQLLLSSRVSLLNVPNDMFSQYIS